MRNTKKGFTLVELLVVIAILAVLATVSVVGYTSFINRANESTAQQELVQLRDYAIAVDMTSGVGDLNGVVDADEAAVAISETGVGEKAVVGNDGTVVKYTVNGASAYWTLANGKVETASEYTGTFTADETTPDEGGEEGGETGGDDNTGDDAQTTPTTVTVTIAGHADSEGWENSVQYTSLVMDSNITVTVSGGANTGKYYTSGTNWRLYSSENATMTVTASEGKTIKTVKVTYTVNSEGVLQYNTTTIESDNVVTVDANSITFNVVDIGSNETKGQARVTAIEVTYQ
ncbi:MAG: prepilin-type N-terminal cleavage/methylation domain-containing protein [Clostridia bacterium]|nr:prepilin-type N-terminal cleavage/methylation domain-containing protein [Clostridia bacterium]